MFLATTRSVTVFACVWLFEGLIINNFIFSFGESISLTPLSPGDSSSIASVSLIENPGYNSQTNNKFICTQKNGDSFCVELDIKNTGCDGIETIKINLYGKGLEDTNTDLFGLFSVENSDSTVDYLSFFNDWSGGVAIGSDTDLGSGGVFIAPNCGDSSLLKFNSNNDIINNFWYGDKNAWNYRPLFAGNDNNNWELLTSKNERVGDFTSPLKYTIVNNLISNTLTTYFNTETITQTLCSYNTVFDTKSGNNYKIGFQTDQGTIELKQFDVDVSCQPKDYCSGCSNGGNINNNDCYAFGNLFDENKSLYGVFGCYGKFSGGMDDISVDNICGENYHPCSSSYEAASLGLTKNECLSVGKNEIFLLREAVGCSNDFSGSKGNDIRGCSGGIDETSMFYENQCVLLGGNRFSTLDVCYGITHLCGYWPRIGDNTNNDILDQGTDGNNEYFNIALKNKNYGGILCCYDN